MTETAALTICRCEEITGAECAAAMAEGARTLNDIKRRTRAGMGMCQGRWCTPALVDLLAAASGQPLAEIAPMTARPPVQPVPLGVLADRED